MRVRKVAFDEKGDVITWEVRGILDVIGFEWLKEMGSLVELSWFQDINAGTAERFKCIFDGSSHVSIEWETPGGKGFTFISGKVVNLGSLIGIELKEGICIFDKSTYDAVGWKVGDGKVVYDCFDPVDYGSWVRLRIGEKKSFFDKMSYRLVELEDEMHDRFSVIKTSYDFGEMVKILSERDHRWRFFNKSTRKVVGWKRKSGEKVFSFHYVQLVDERLMAFLEDSSRGLVFNVKTRKEVG